MCSAPYARHGPPRLGRAAVRDRRRAPAGARGRRPETRRARRRPAWRRTARSSRPESGQRLRSARDGVVEAPAGVEDRDRRSRRLPANALDAPGPGRPVSADLGEVGLGERRRVGEQVRQAERGDAGDRRAVAPRRGGPRAWSRPRPRPAGRGRRARRSRTGRSRRARAARGRRAHERAQQLVAGERGVDHRRVGVEVEQPAHAARRGARARRTRGGARGGAARRAVGSFHTSMTPGVAAELDRAAVDARVEVDGFDPGIARGARNASSASHASGGAVRDAQLEAAVGDEAVGLARRRARSSLRA